MKRGWLALLVVPAVAVVAGAAYLGLQSGQAQNNPAAPPPQTVPVTRGDVVQSVAAPGELEATRQQELVFTTTGQLATLNVRPGDAVQAGQVLAQLDLKPLQKTLDEARAALKRAQPENARQLAAAQLDLQTAQTKLAQAQASLPKTGDQNENLAIAQRRLEQAKNQLWAAQSQRDSVCGHGKSTQCDQAQAVVQADEEAVRIAELQVQQEQAKEQSDLAAAQSNLKVLQAAVDQAQLKVDGLKQGVDPALIQAVDDAQAALDGATLKAPFAGVVLEVSAQVGEQMGPSRSFILLGDPTALEVRSTVIEEDLPLVQPGQAVDLAFDAQPDLSVTAHVARIVPERCDPDRPLYPVYISVDSPAPGMFPGMTADATITIARRQNVLRLPRALVHAGASDMAQVRVWANGQTEQRTIKIGLRGDVYVEILGGLHEGDQVVSG